MDGAGFLLSPNPVRGAVTVMFPQPLEKDVELSLFDLGGREMRRMTVAAGNVKVDFDVEGCPAGAYLLKMVGPQGTTTRRLLVE